MEKLLDRAPAMGNKIYNLMIIWGRACLTSRNGTLYGEKKENYTITRKRLMAEVKVWRTATMLEPLIRNAHTRMEKKTLKTAASITIATWLDEMQDLRQKIKHRRTTNIIMSHATPEEHQEADVRF